MSSPNIVNVATITGKTAAMSPTTNAATVVTNAASSGKVLKVNTIIAANIHGTNACNITLNLYPEDDVGGTGVAICSTVSVLPNTSAVLIEKNSSLYLEENTSIGAIAGASGDIQIVCSYEEIS